MAEENTPNTAPPVYDDRAIVTQQGLSFIRSRPTFYIDDIEITGQIQLAKEAFDNSLDELFEISKTGGHATLTIVMCLDLSRNTYQMIIKDTGRSIPIGKRPDGIYTLFASLCIPQSSGKYNPSVYSTSAGLFGVGLKVVAALTRIFRGISHRLEGSASIKVRQSEPESETPEFDTTPNTQTGMTIVYEPDETIYRQIPEFMTSGYVGIIELLKQYTAMFPFDITFKISQLPLPAYYMDLPIAKADQTTDELIASADTVWSSASFDRVAWLRNYWKITRPFAWEYGFSEVAPYKSSKLERFEIALFYVKFDRTGGLFGGVNNHPLKTMASDNYKVVYDLVVKEVAVRIGDKAVRDFFVNAYKLPLFIYASACFSGAEFTGATKYAYKGDEFRELYSAQIHKYLANEEGQIKINELYDLLKEDIEARYQESIMGNTQVKTRGRLNEMLKRPENFSDCKEKNRSLCELFLVEGESASPSKYDKNTQGIYRMRGKPLNVLARYDPITQRSEFLDRMLKNEVYYDIFAIINFNPLKPDLTKLYFQKILLLTDADTHGQHIAALVMSNIQAAAPELVQAGIFGVVLPPYYEVWYGKRRSTKTNLYIKEQADIVEWSASTLYYTGIDVAIHSRQNNALEFVLDENQFVSFAKFVCRVGTVLDNLANELSIPAALIESLVHASYYLTDTTMNIDRIREITGLNATYSAVNNVLRCSIGREDYSLPLHQVPDKFYAELRPLMMNMKTHLWYITARNRRPNNQAPYRPTTIYQLYSAFKNMDKLISVRPLKGLGSMDDADVGQICMDRRTRRTYDITSAGDVDRVFALLGDNSEPRKQLLRAPVDFSAENIPL